MPAQPLAQQSPSADDASAFVPQQPDSDDENGHAPPSNAIYAPVPAIATAAAAATRILVNMGLVLVVRERVRFGLRG